MKALKLHKIVLPFFVLLAVVGCSKKEDEVQTDEEQFPDNNSIVEYVYADAPENYSTIMDVRRIPVDDYLLQIDNEELQDYLASIQQFNEHMDHPAEMFDASSLKSASEAMYEKECEEHDWSTECTYTYHYRTYTYTIVLTSYQFPFLYLTYENYIKGKCDGVDYTAYDDENDGLGYLISESEYRPYYSCDITYRYPDPIEQAEEPVFKWEVISYDSIFSIYTPGGGDEIISTTDYISTTYYFDHIRNWNHEWIRNSTRITGSAMIMTSEVWSINKERMYIRWVGMHDFENHNGHWYSYDEDGNITNEGDW